MLGNIYLLSFFAHTFQTLCVSPRFTKAIYFPALGKRYKISRTFQTLHVFPRFLNATLFPALFKRHTIPLSPQLNLNLNIYFCEHC